MPLSGIRARDPSVRVGENDSSLSSRGHHQFHVTQILKQYTRNPLYYHHCISFLAYFPYFEKQKVAYEVTLLVSRSVYPSVYSPSILRLMLSLCCLCILQKF
jgi:hypothetical protein